MASHVVVVDSTARRVTVKTTPTTYLSDVRDEACRRLNLKADQYILKRDKKVIDLSITARLANLPQGTKLDLIQASRSPSVINVALQLPESDGNIRLTEKFPSNTSLWQILRIFESKPPPGPTGPRTFNFTQRGYAAQTGSGGGRIYYASPVLNIMQRERSSFTELQQTLAQLGFNGGNALIRLTFKNSEQPLEEAMAEISQYFKEIDATGAQNEGTSVVGTANASKSSEATAQSSQPEVSAAQQTMETKQPIKPESTPAPPQVTDEATPASDNSIVGPGERSISVFSPPTNSTPQAARQAFDADDYVPTVDHAKTHQARLLDQSRNKRLLSDAELAEQERIRNEKIASIPGVTLRVRFPDQSQVETTFNSTENVATLYNFVREMLQFPDQPFHLRYVGLKGNQTLKDGPEKLVKDLGFQGRVLVSFIWEQTASADARRGPPLKSNWMEKAQALKVHEPVLDVSSGAGSTATPAKDDKGKGKGKLSDIDIESKMRNFLNKGLFKKK